MTSSLIQLVLISLALALMSTKLVSSALFCLCCFWIIIIVIIIQHKLQRKYLQRELFLCHFMSRSRQLLIAGGVIGSTRRIFKHIWNLNLRIQHGNISFEKDLTEESQQRLKFCQQVSLQCNGSFPSRIRVFRLMKHLIIIMFPK